MQYTTKSDQNLATLKTDCLVALIFDGDGPKKASQELGTAIAGIVKSLLASGDPVSYTHLRLPTTPYV